MSNIGELRWLHDSMDLCGEVISIRPTLLGKRYTIRVLWDNNTYTDFQRIWWRTWS